MADFEFVPSRELKQLEQELIQIKSHPMMQDKDGQKLQDTMLALHQSMERMLDVFKKATSDMELEEREDMLMQKHLGPVAKEVSHISDQNETLAEAIVNINDMVEELKQQVSTISRQQKDILSQLGDIEASLRDPTRNIPMPPPRPMMQSQPIPEFQPSPEMYQQQFPPMPSVSMPPPPFPSPSGTNAIPPLPKDGLAKKKRGLFG